MRRITLSKRILTLLANRKELAIPLFILAYTLGVWGLFRLLLVVINIKHINWSWDVVKMLPVSIRFDLMAFAYIWGIFIVLYLLTPQKVAHHAHRFLWKPIAVFIIGLIIYLELATVSFMAEYGNRLDRLSVEYLIYPQEVLSMISKGYKTEVALGGITTLFLVWVFLNSYTYIVEKTPKDFSTFSFIKKPILALCVLAIFGVCARSSLGHRPANISSASFSTQHIVNELTLNSSYTLIYSLYRMKHESNPFDIYDSMSEDKIFSLAREFSESDGKTFNTEGKGIHNTAMASTTANTPKYNLVIVLEESLGSDFIGRQGGTNTSPEIDRISQDGIFFDQLYATGTRTVRGLEATLSGFPPTPGRSVVKLSKAKENFWTIATHLKQYGYSNMFFYGGDTNFDDMKSFLRGNHFDEIEDLTTIKGDYELGSWGIHDEDVFSIANTALNEKHKQGKPFLAVILSTSNHTPFDYPAEKIDLNPDFDQLSHENAIKYSDYALGTFYDAAKESDYFKDTIFLFVADHNTRVKGHDLIPVHKFRIPGILIGPNIPKMTYSKVCSNIDLLPTILHYMNLEGDTPLLGRDLMCLSEDDPGRAIMQYGNTFGFRIGDKISIMRPYSKTLDFRYDGMNLSPVAEDKELNELALAHALLPWILYSDRLYY